MMMIMVIMIMSSSSITSQVAFLPGFLSINQLGSCDLGKLLVFDVQKKLYKLPELGGGGGGRGNLGNARKKTFFFPGGVPHTSYLSFFLHLSNFWLNFSPRKSA